MQAMAPTMSFGSFSAAWSYSLPIFIWVTGSRRAAKWPIRRAFVRSRGWLRGCGGDCREGCMIRNVKIGKVALPRTPYTPKRLLPIIEAVGAGEPLETLLTTIVNDLGFNTFMFGMSACPALNHESQIYAYTTLPVEWVARYDQMDYIEVDPRVLKTRDSPLPLVWDSHSERGSDERTDRSEEDAATHGVSSGFAFEFNDVRYVRGLMALNSPNPIIDDAQRETIGAMLGEILLLGTYFHEIFRKGFVRSEEHTSELQSRRD